MHFPKVIISQESRRNHGSVVSCWNSFLPRKRIIPGWQLDFGFGFLVTKNRELSFYENYPLAKKSRKENHGKVFFIMTFKIFSRNDASSILRICFFVQNSRIGVKNEISESWFTILSWNYIYCHIIIIHEGRIPKFSEIECFNFFLKKLFSPLVTPFEISISCLFARIRSTW